jgi:hypothetical protein
MFPPGRFPAQREWKMYLWDRCESERARGEGCGGRHSRESWSIPVLQQGSRIAHLAREFDARLAQFGPHACVLVCSCAAAGASAIFTV